MIVNENLSAPKKDLLLEAFVACENDDDIISMWSYTPTILRGRILASSYLFSKGLYDLRKLCADLQKGAVSVEARIHQGWVLQNFAFKSMRKKYKLEEATHVLYCGFSLGKLEFGPEPGVFQLLLRHKYVLVYKNRSRKTLHIKMWLTT